MLFTFAFIFFVLGYALRFLLDIIKIGTYFAKIGVVLEVECLKFAKEMDERVTQRLKDCGERCVSRGDTREILKLYNNEDEEDLKKWREGILKTISENFPEHVRRDFGHETWEEAMNNVNAYYLLLEVKKLQDNNSGKKDGDKV